MDLTVSNRGTEAVDKIVLTAFPNRFTGEAHNLDDLSYRLVYPDRTTFGSIRIEGMETEEGVPLSAGDLPFQDLPEGTFLTVPLSSPIAPGGSQSIRLKFSVEVPEKFGSHGFYRGSTTLSGGWTPFIPSYAQGEGFRLQDAPPPADWDVSVISDRPLVLGRNWYEDARDGVLYRVPATRMITMFHAASPLVHEIACGGRLVRILTVSANPAVRKALYRLVDRWTAFVEERAELDQFRTPINLVEAPLRRFLVSHGEGTAFFSDRALKLPALIEKYHSISIIQGLFYQLLLPAVSARESSRDYHAVTEALAWRWTERYAASAGFTHTDARRLPVIRALSFLLTIDRIIYAPQFPFSDSYFDALHPRDPVREDALNFNHRRPAGRSILAAMEDEIGTRFTDEAVDAYLADGKERFSKTVSAVSGMDLSHLFEQWISQRPRVNYALGDRMSRIENGMWRHEVEVRREGDTTISEPVELLVTARNHERRKLQWREAGPKHVFAFDTEFPLASVEIDPRRRLRETDLSDNRHPPRFKMVLTDYVIEFDFNEKTPYGYVSGVVRRTYGGRNRYTFGASYFGDVYGGSVGYTRLFGRLIDRLRLYHGLGVGYSVNRLDRDTVWAESSAWASRIPVEVSPAGFATAVSASYFFGNQLSLTNPLKGGYASLNATVGSTALGGDFRYYRLGAGASWIIPFNAAHLLVVRGAIGTAGPHDMPTPVRYGLGGLNGIRGLSAGDDRFKGRHMLLTSAEYRHLLFRDIDINLGLFRIRDIQGALFAGGGNVAGTVEERALDLSFGTGSRTGFLDLFDLGNFATDAGYGLRFLLDYIGVNPGLLRVDVAKGLSPDPGGAVRIYFGVTQSF